MKKIKVLVLGFLIFLAACSSSPPEPEILNENFEVKQSTSGFLPQGQVLAGDMPYYIEANKEDIENALVTQEVVVLNFYANWCPSCKDEDNEIREYFKNSTTDDITLFRVNYRDSDTSEYEELLAEEFDVNAQGTKIIFVNGEQVQRGAGHYNFEGYVELFNQY